MMQSDISVFKFWREPVLVRVDRCAWVFWALWILVLPLNWIIAAFASAVIHELFHILAILLLGGKVHCITAGPFGAVIETKELDGIQKSVCALAGPLGSFLVALWIHKIPLLGLCALIQGVFNCLPVYPLDGGMALHYIFEKFFPLYSRQISKLVELFVFLFFLGIAIYVTFRFACGFGPILCAVVVIAHVLLRKRP